MHPDVTHPATMSLHPHTITPCDRVCKKHYNHNAPCEQPTHRGIWTRGKTMSEVKRTYRGVEQGRGMRGGGVGGMGGEGADCRARRGDHHSTSDAGISSWASDSRSR